MTTTCSEKCNLAREQCRNMDKMRYVGYGKDNECGDCMEILFSNATVQKISQSVTKLLGKDLARGRPIVVPDDTILSVLSQVNDSFRDQTGDIYGRYNVPNNNLPVYDQLVYQTITIIVDNVRNTLEMENINGSLNIWDTVLGDFNARGLRSHAPLTAEIDNTRRLFQIHMRY